MGSAFNSGGRTEGVIPRAMVDIFARIAETTDAEFIVRVSFVEIFKAWPASNGSSPAWLRNVNHAVALTCWACVRTWRDIGHAS